jgi:hypothetical protein
MKNLILQNIVDLISEMLKDEKCGMTKASKIVEMKYKEKDASLGPDGLLVEENSGNY